MRVVDGVRKIAVLRANGIGDYIFAIPALQALRSAYPNAEIVLLALPWHQEFLDRRPGPADRVIVVPFSRGIRDSRPAEDGAALEGFFQKMADERFDLALQMHGGGRFSNPFVRRLGARLTAGCRTPDAAPLDRWLPYVYYQNEVIRNLEVASLVGAQPTGYRPAIPIQEDDIIEAQRLVGDQEAVAVINPGATDPRRCWDALSFAEVGDWLSSRGLRVVITGTCEQRATSDRVQNAMRHEPLNLTGQTSLSALIGILHHAALVVSNDTGPLHIAHALGTPSVGIFWCGNLVTAGILSRSNHRPVTSWLVNCPLCGADIASGRGLTDAQRACEHETSFVFLVPTNEIIQAAADLLSQWPSLPASHKPAGAVARPA